MSILWDKRISKEDKNGIYLTIVKTIVIYCSEIWLIKDKAEKILKTTSIDFWKREAGRSRMERVMNDTIIEIMVVTHSGR